MSVYTELLRLVVANDALEDDPVESLVSQLIAARPHGRATDSAEDELADWLAYDAALVRLCDRLGVPHGMLGPDSGPATRSRAEELVAERVPAIGRTLGIG